MSAKYSRIPTSDPDSVSLDFGSIHSFEEANQYTSKFDYGPSVEKKYKSAFTYAGFDPNKKIESVEVTEPSIVCKVCATVVTVLCFILLAVTFPISAWFSLRSIQTYERLVIYRLGRLVAAKGPGMVFVLPFIDVCTKVDLRMKAFSVPPQKSLTADGATVEVGADIYYRVKDAVTSVSNVQDLNRSTRVIAETTLQKHLCKYELSDITLNKTNMTHALINDINEMTLTWGAEVTRANLSQVKVIAEANPLIQQSNNPLNFLGPLLFPPGTNMPADGMGAIQQMMSAAGGQMAGSAGVPAGSAGTMAGGSSGSGGQGDAAMGHPQVLSRMQQEQLKALQAQHPHLKQELEMLMKSQAPLVDASGASGPSSNGLRRFRTPVDLLKAVVPRLSSELVAQFMCIYKFIVTGEGGGTFFLDLKYDEGEADEGEPRKGPADVTLTLSVDDLDGLLSGETSAFAAYMTGRIEVQGDMGLASKLGEIVNLLK